MDLHGDALKRILGDMDDLEGKKMFPMPEGNGGATITISVTPNGGDADGDNDGDEFPEGHDEAMCKGGCAYHKGGMVEEEANTAEKLPAMPKMAEGGMVPQMGETEDLSLPPFLRKKRGMGAK